MAREGARGRAGPGEEGIGVKFRRGKACEGKEGRREVLGGERGKNCLARGGVERSFRRSAVSPHRLARSGHHPFTVRTGVRIPVGTPAAPEAWGFRFGTPEGFDGASGASGEGQAAGLGRSPERSESIPVGTPAAPEAWGFGHGRNVCPVLADLYVQRTWQVFRVIEGGSCHLPAPHRLVSETPDFRGVITEIIRSTRS